MFLCVEGHYVMKTTESPLMKFPPAFKKVSSSYLTFFLLTLSLPPPSSGLVPASLEHSLSDRLVGELSFFHCGSACKI